MARFLVSGGSGTSVLLFCAKSDFVFLIPLSHLEKARSQIPALLQMW